MSTFLHNTEKDFQTTSIPEILRVNAIFLIGNDGNFSLCKGPAPYVNRGEKKRDFTIAGLVVCLILRDVSQPYNDSVALLDSLMLPVLLLQMLSRGIFDSLWLISASDQHVSVKGSVIPAKAGIYVLER